MQEIQLLRKHKKPSLTGHEKQTNGEGGGVFQCGIHQ